MNKFFEADVKGQNKVSSVIRDMFSGYDTTAEYGAKKNKKNKLLKIEDSKCIVKMK